MLFICLYTYHWGGWGGGIGIPLSLIPLGGGIYPPLLSAPRGVYVTLGANVVNAQAHRRAEPGLEPIAVLQPRHFREACQLPPG